ncbi:MAG: hypothetical protein ACI8X5_003025 [Planctomycetota bacterium]|jgi:hypothetical protein
MTILFVCALILLFVAPWGPGQHLEFSERTLRRSERLPRDVEKLLQEEKEAFQYGSIAADIINFKAYGGDYNHCHRWTIIDEMREIARTPKQEAFIFGYLAHLCADTVAHNHFVPYHLCRFARTKGLGHLYWELSADRFVSESRWKIIPRLKTIDDVTELDDLVNRTVPRKALSMGANKLIFNNVLLVSERDSWRRMMLKLHPIEKVRLGKGFLAKFQKAACERITLAMSPGGFERIRSLDPNGKVAQKQAFALRKKIVTRWAPGRMRQQESTELAKPFLEGMGLPEC